MSKRCSCETNLSAMGIKGLRHDGTSRNRRWLKALSPEYVKIDERRLEDLLCFLEKYATLIAYYNSQNKPDGNWQDFITTDISTLLAKIVKTNYRLVGETFRRYLDILKDSLSAEDYKPLFDIMARSFHCRFRLSWESPNSNFDRKDRTVVVDVCLGAFRGRGTGTYWLDHRAPSKTLQVKRRSAGDPGLSRLLPAVTNRIEPGMMPTAVPST